MKDHDLLEAVGGINEKYINNAGKNGTPQNRKTYLRWFVAVACICVVVMVLLVPKFTKEQEDTNVGNISAQNGDNSALDTQIVDSEEETVSEEIGDYPPMIVVGRKTYKDTYEVYQDEINEESIMKSVSYTDGCPKQEGEQNFDRGDVEYVTIDDNTVICKVDGQWQIFKLYENEN